MRRSRAATQPTLDIVTARASLAPDLCPLCGKPNRCAMESSRAAAADQPPCWCVGVDFSPELLERLPAAARGKACICEACARPLPADSVKVS